MRSWYAGGPNMWDCVHAASPYGCAAPNDPNMWVHFPSVSKAVVNYYHW